jgi:hypothetical protein
MFGSGGMGTSNKLSRWRPVRLSLRSLLALFLVFGVWLSWTVHDARVQRDATATIRRAGGNVAYSWQLKKDGHHTSKGRPWWPNWLVDFVGVDYLGTVAGVTLADNREADTVLVHIGHLSRLEGLSLSQSSATDAGLDHIEGLTNLKWLDLHGTKVTDAGLAHLKRLTGLRKLHLSETKISDAGLADLKELTHLETLTLYTTRVSDVGLAQLKGLIRLEELYINGTEVRRPECLKRESSPVTFDAEDLIFSIWENKIRDVRFRSQLTSSE